MGLDSIWDEDGEWLTSDSKGFKARSTGCSCCSIELSNEQEVREECVKSLSWILRAGYYFNWDFEDLMKDANVKLESRE